LSCGCLISVVAACWAVSCFPNPADVSGALDIRVAPGIADGLELGLEEVTIPSTEPQLGRGKRARIANRKCYDYKTH
jgi:hypothetical protein